MAQPASDLTSAASGGKLLFRVKEAAQQLSISPAQAYNLINKGEIEVVRLGGSIRVPAWALEKIAGAGIAPDVIQARTDG